MTEIDPIPPPPEPPPNPALAAAAEARQRRAEAARVQRALQLDEHIAAAQLRVQQHRERLGEAERRLARLEAERAEVEAAAPAPIDAEFAEVEP